MIKAEKVNKLCKEGRTFDLLYLCKDMEYKPVANITLEYGVEMTNELAFEIINQTFVSMGYKPRKDINKVKFIEV